MALKGIVNCSWSTTSFALIEEHFGYLDSVLNFEKMMTTDQKALLHQDGIEDRPHIAFIILNKLLCLPS